MRFFGSVVSMVFCILIASAAWADEGGETVREKGFYFSIVPSVVCPFSVDTTSPGLSPAKVETKWGAGLDGGLGYRCGNFRIEGRLTYLKSDGDDISFAGGGGGIAGHYNMWGLSADFFYDFPTEARLRPYVGAGLGGARFEADDITLAGFPPTQGRNTVFTYKLMTGVTYELNREWSLLLGYRFMGLEEQDFETGGVVLNGDSIHIHSVQMGLQFYF